MILAILSNYFKLKLKATKAARRFCKVERNETIFHTATKRV